MRRHEPIRRLFQMNPKVKMPLLWLSLLNLVMSMTAIFFAFFSREAIDLAMANDPNRFVISAVILGGILFIQIVASTLSPYLKTYFAGKTNHRLKSVFFTKLLRSEVSSSKTMHTGQMMNYLYSDIDIVSDGMLDVIPKAIFYLFRFLGAFVLLFFLDPIFSMALVAVGLVLMLASRLLSGVYKRRHQALQNAEATVRALLQESLDHIEVIKAFEAEDHLASRLNDSQGTHFKAIMKKQNVSSLTSFGMNTFFAFGYGLAIIIGAIRLSEGFITFGALMAMIQLVGHIQSPFSGLSQLIPKYYSLSASASRLLMLDGLQDDVKEKADVKEFDKIVFERVSFRYDEKMVIDTLSTTITKGSIIRILGDSGTGKTTFFKLLLGLYAPTRGKLYGVIKSRHVPISPSTRHLFSYVPQGNFMLSGTIRENLCLYQDATEEQIITACRTAEILTDILNLSQGFNTVLGEHGAGFSEGQIQRLAIARALIKNAPILLLDEVTSALDQDTEKKIYQSIRQMADKTVFIVTHRDFDSKLYDLTLSI